MLHTERNIQNVFWKKLNYSNGEAHLSSSILGEKLALALSAERDGTEAKGINVPCDQQGSQGKAELGLEWV